MRATDQNGLGRVLGPIATPPDAVTAWLRLEGFVLLIASIALYVHLGASGVWFAALILAPDVFILGYRINPRVGAMAYNFAHNKALPVVIGVSGVLLKDSSLTALALIWLAHVGLDRALGFGLKYPSSYHDTHLVNRGS
jgi:Domain of unknown function (DUF4260)